MANFSSLVVFYVIFGLATVRLAVSVEKGSTNATLDRICIEEATKRASGGNPCPYFDKCCKRSCGDTDDTKSHIDCLLQRDAPTIINPISTFCYCNSASMVMPAALVLISALLFKFL